jgi:predicted nucleotidyltransferase
MPLVSLLFPEYRRRVLALLLLHPERGLHLREIARLTGTVPGTLARELRRLTDAGIIRRERIGNQARFSADPGCPVFGELASILRKTSGLADVIAAALLPVAERIDTAFVFGSAAAGVATPGSDIDLMVIGDVDFANIVSLVRPLEPVLGREINPTIFRLAEWQERLQRGDGFAVDIMSRPRLMLIGGTNEPAES